MASSSATAEGTVTDWDAQTLYQVGDTVRHEGAIWEATINSRNAVPSDSSVYWERISDGSDGGSCTKPPENGTETEPDPTPVQGTFEIAVWLSEGLTSWSQSNFGDPWRAQQRTKTAIEEAFARSHVPYAVDVTLPSIAVPAVEVGPFDSFTGPQIDGTGQTTYEHPLDFYTEWLRSDRKPGEPVPHSNLVLFDGGGGGLSWVGSNVGTYAGGRSIARLGEEYVPFAAEGVGDRSGLVGALHEIGHNLIVGEPTHHDLAGLHERPEGTMKTVMGSSGTENYCGDPAPTEADGRELTYSRCAVSHFKDV